MGALSTELQGAFGRSLSYSFTSKPFPSFGRVLINPQRWQNIDVELKQEGQCNTSTLQTPRAVQLDLKMYCQKCRTPLKLDSSLEDLNPAAFDLLVGMQFYFKLLKAWLTCERRIFTTASQEHLLIPTSLPSRTKGLLRSRLQKCSLSHFQTDHFWPAWTGQ